MQDEKITNLSGTPNYPVERNYNSDGTPLKNDYSALFDSSLSNLQPKAEGYAASQIMMSETAPYKTGRYSNVMYGGNNEEAYAQDQSFAGKMISGVGKGLSLTATTFLQTTYGMVNGLAKSIKDGKYSSFYDNEFNKTLDKWNEELENKLPNYYSQQEKNAHWYSPNYWFTGNFLWDGVVKNLGFSAGAALSGGVYAAALKGLAYLPGLARLVSIGKLAEAAAAAENKIAQGSEVINTLGKIEEASKKFMSAYNVLSPGGRAVVAGLSTSGEAGFEAYQNLNQYRDQKIQEYKDKYHEEPTGEDLLKINQEADAVGNWSFGLNVALLSCTNYIQFPKILGSTYKAEKGITNAVTREVGEIVKEGETFIEKPIKNKILRTLNGIRPYTFSTSEGFEEGAQYAIQIGTQDYYDKQHKGEPTSFFTSLAEGVKQTLGTDQGMQNVLIGGLSGAWMMARGNYKEQKAERLNTADAVTKFNEKHLSDFTKDTRASIQRGTVLQQERIAAIENGDIINSKDLEHDYIINYLMPRIKYGRYDLVKADIEDYKKLASTDEGWKQLIDEGKALPTDTREAFLNRIASLENTAEKTKSLYQSIALRYGGLKKGKELLYSPEVLDKMTYAASKVADYDDRLPSLIAKLASPDILTSGIDINAIIQDIHDGKVQSYNEAVEKIKTLQSVNKDEYGQTLDDIAEMTLRRSKFLDEYENMKMSPEKYIEKKEEPLAETPISSEEEKAKKKITIKTKYGERQVETNTEYVIGKTIQKDEQGRDVFGAPVIKIVDENEDGTIKIRYKDANGKGIERDITKEKLESYAVVKRSDLQKNKKANFVYEHWNTIFKHWGIKDVNGNPVTGRIEYSPTKHQILFKYIDDKGKERKREIIGRNVVFDKQKYNHPMLEAVGELKASQRTAQEEMGNEKSSLSDQLTLRNNVISSMYENGVARIEQITKTLTSNKEQLIKHETTIKEETKNLQAELSKDQSKKSVQKKVRAIEASIKNLTDLHEKIGKKNIELQNEKEELEYNLPIFKEILDSIDSSADEATELVQQLKNDVDNSNKLIDTISEQIKTNKSLLEQIEKVLKEGLSILKDHITKLQEANPGIPLSIEDFQASIEKYLGEEGVKQLIAERGGFTEQVLSLEADINAFEEELQIPSLSKKVNDLQKELSTLNDQLEDAIKTQKAKSKIYEAFKEFVDKLAQEAAEEKAFEENIELKNQYIGTMDNAVQNVFSEINYEPASKKSFWAALRGSIPITLTDRQKEKGETEKPHNVRSNKFGFKFAKFSEDKQAAIRGIVVTPNTQNDILPGLTDFLYNNMTPEQQREYKKEEIISLVMVQMNDDGQTYSLVDENGEVIPEKDDNGNTVNPLDKAIFQTFHMGNMKGWYKNKEGNWEEQSIFRDDVSDERKVEAGEQYNNWRKTTLAKTTLDAPEKIKVSFGNPELATKYDDDGIHQVRDAGARVSAKKAGFISDEDLQKKQVLTVSTQDEESEGEVTFRNSKGRVFLRIPGMGLVKLFNRKFSERESNVIFDVIHQICKNGVKKGAISTETNMLLDWLKTVVYWGIAKDPNTNERKPAGYNNIWFETVQEDGKPVTRLFISGITKDSKQAFMFTPTGLQESKYQIVQLLQELYHNTHATRVNQNSWQSFYYEITGIDEEGKPITKEWSNYQTYLLSDKGREANEIPLVTQYRPLNDEDDVNRKGIYFTLNSPTDAFKFEAEKKTPKAPKTKKEVNKPETKEAKAKKKEEKKEEGTAYKPAPLKLDGSDEVMHFDSFGGFDVMFKLNAKTCNEKGTIDGLSVPSDIVSKIMLEKAMTQEQVQNLIAGSLIVKLKDQLNLAAVPKAEPIKDTPQEKTEENKEETPEEDDGIPSVRDKNAEKRFAPVENPIIYEQEDWDKVEKFLTEKFSTLPVYRVKNVIRGTNGRQIWGMLHNAAIYLHENAEVGSIYHEVFESVWKLFAGPQEKQKVLDEFRSRDGEYTSRFEVDENGKFIKIKYSEATNQQIKEEIAEEFRDFQLYGKSVVKPRGKNFISRLFQDIVNFFKEFFFGEKARTNTQELFDKIGNGYYNKFNPYESKLSFAKQGFINIDDAFADENSELREKIPTQQTHDIIQHMTFALLRDLVKTNQSLFRVEKWGKSEIYANLRLEILGRIKGLREDAAEKAKNGEQSAIDEVNNLKQLYDNTKEEWNALVERHEQFLNTRGISFDENDELNVEDAEKSKDEPYGNPRQVDAFRKSNAAIKLLLGSLAYSQKVKRMVNGKEVISTDWIPSTIGGARLLSPDQVHIDLVNKLHKACDLDDMLGMLRKEAMANPNYEALYWRLTKQTLAESTIDYDKFEQHDWQLISAFWKSMKLQNPDALTVFILADGQVIITDSSMNSAAKQAKKEMFYSMVEKIKDGTKFFTYNKNNGKYTATRTLKEMTFSGTDLTNYITFLKELGINFDIENLNDLRPTQLRHFRDAVRGIHKSLSALGPVVNRAGYPVDEDGHVVNPVTKLSEQGKPQNDKSIYSLTSKTLDIEGRLTQLGVINSIIEKPEFESTYFNINGERTQTYIGGNAISRLYDTISSLGNINELNSDIKDYKQFKYLLTDAFAKGSLILNRIFLMGEGESGARREGTENILKPAVIDGLMDEEKGKKKESARESYKQRLAQEINLNSEGVYLNLVPADASMEHATKLHEEEAPFVTDDMFLTGNYFSIFKDYFISEMNLSRDKNRRVVRGKKKTDLRFFKDILGEELHNNIISKENKKLSPDEVYTKYKGEIEKAVKDFILKEGKDTYELLRMFDIIKDDVEGLTVENLNFANDMDVTEENVKTKLNVLSANYIIANIEMHKLLYSDPYQYENELKRIKNFLSPRQYLMHGSSRVNSALNKVYNKGYKKGDLGYTDMERDNFRVVTLADIYSTADLDGYDPFEETDGGGGITIKGKRMLMLKTGMWTDELERQYRHDIEFERIAKETKKDSEREKLLAEHEKNNPGIKDLYTPLKPSVAGNKANGRNYNDALLHKFALSVYSYRILHSIDHSSNALRLYNKMQDEDIDYFVFASGAKVGAEKLFNVYNEDGSFNTSPFETEEEKNDVNLEQGITKVPYSIMAIQSEVPTKEENTSTIGSQMTKLATMDFMDAGMPIDFEAKEKDFDKRFAKWILLKDKSSYNKGDNLYNEIQHNQKLIEARIATAYAFLLDRMGIEQNKEGFKLVDKEKLAKNLSSEIMRREVNDNIINVFKEFLQKDAILEASPSYQQIRHILYSIADKAIVHPKITGGLKVQIPSSFLESIKAKGIQTKTKKGKPVTAYQSDILKFYVDEDGKRHCEIMIGRWFDSNKSDAELLHYFNETEEGRKEAKALFGVAFRIPTQKQNSIDVFKIAQFLPKEYGDSVVIPSALVKKAGSDFDIDKLSIYLKNVYNNAKGNIKVIPFYGYGNQAIEKFKQLYYDEIDEKLDVLNKKHTEQTSLQKLFGDIALGLKDEKTTNKWISIFKQWFKDETVDGKLSVEEIEDIFVKRIEKLNKKIDKLNDLDIQEIVAAETAERWYKQSLENEYIESLERLISHPLNFKHLVKPNSSEQLEELESDVSEKLGEKKIDYSDVGNMLSRKFMSSLRQAFLGGKQAIAIAAVSQTNNAQNQRSVMYIDTDRLNTPGIISVEDVDILGGEPTSEIFATNPNINFQEYNSIIVKGKRVATLSKSQDANINPKKRNFISDIIAQFIDGYVDITKNGPWIMRLGATPTLAPTWLFLIKLGVPVKSVAYFMNQPIIKDYVRDIENKGYSWLFIGDFIEKALDKYSPSKEESITIIPSEEELFTTVGKNVKDMSNLELAQQQYMLKEFLKYAKMSSHLLQVTQGSNFDTAYLSDPLIAFKKLMQYEKAKNSIISSVDDILDQSFVRMLKDVIYSVRKAFAEVLISDKSRAREVLENVLGPYINLNDRDFLKLAQKAVGDLFDWTMQVDKDAARKIASVLVSKKDINDKQINSYVKQIIDFKDKIIGNASKDIKGDVNHPLYNNFVLKSLQLKPGMKEGRVENLLINGKSNKVYDQNMIIHGFEEIRDYLKEKGDDTLYRKLIAVTVMQSGLKRSILSFTDLLPYEDFKDVYYDALFKMNDSPYLSDFHTAHIFERNNYNDDDIIPFIKDKFTQGKENVLNPLKKNLYYKNQLFIGDALLAAKKEKNVPMIASMDIHSRSAASDFMVYSWQDEISNKQRIKRRKSGDISHIHKLLMKKVYFTDEKGVRKPLIFTSEVVGKDGEVRIYKRYIYKAINTLGDSYMAQEFPMKKEPRIPESTLMNPSLIDNGFDKVEEKLDDTGKRISSGEVEDETVVYYFNKEVKSKKKNDYKVVEEPAYLSTLKTPEFNKLPSKSVTPTMTYAGIGSRSTPVEIKDKMTALAKELEVKGYTLNTGKPEDENTKGGADEAFRKGATKKNLFGTADANERTKTIAKEIHPNPSALGSKALLYQARNTNQVFGRDLNTPIDFVIAWTPDALTNSKDRTIKSGGTGQAIDMASRKGIPVINMANANWREQLDDILSPKQNAPENEISDVLKKKEEESKKCN